MTTFICYGNFTDQGAKTMKEGPKRAEATKALVEKLGGRLVGMYVTTGQYDLVIIADMPSGDAMAKLAISISSQGNVRTTTVRAFAPAEMGKLISEAL
jgi:uncharacterized protein with GYD domain